ncbi:hypothetical protein ACFE04_018597 [Oxalis oulophora]
MSTRLCMVDVEPDYEVSIMTNEIKNVGRHSMSINVDNLCRLNGLLDGKLTMVAKAKIVTDGAFSPAMVHFRKLNQNEYKVVVMVDIEPDYEVPIPTNEIKTVGQARDGFKHCELKTLDVDLDQPFSKHRSMCNSFGGSPRPEAIELTESALIEFHHRRGNEWNRNSLTWTVVDVPNQPGLTECALYVMRYRSLIISSRKRIFSNKCIEGEMCRILHVSNFTNVLDGAQANLKMVEF